MIPSKAPPAVTTTRRLVEAPVQKNKEQAAQVAQARREAVLAKKKRKR